MSVVQLPRSPVSAILPVGTHLWRPCDRRYTRVLTPDVESNGGPSGFVRVLLCGYRQGICEPVINPHLGGEKRFGVVCFLPGELGEDWIALRVARHSKSGNALFVEPVPGDVEEYLSFRAQACGLRDLCEDGGINWPTLMEETRTIGPCVSRVQLMYNGDGFDVLQGE